MDTLFNHDDNRNKPKKIIIGNKKKKQIKSEEKEITNKECIKEIQLYKPFFSQKSNTCLDCQTEIYQKNLRCTFCMNKKKFQDNCKETNRPSYKDLIKSVNDIGYSATGRLYGVSDNAIRKWIKAYKKFTL